VPVNGPLIAGATPAGGSVPSRSEGSSATDRHTDETLDGACQQFDEESFNEVLTYYGSNSNVQVCVIVRENVRNTAKNLKITTFWILKKNVKNVEVITYRSIVMKITVTTLNQFCCLLHNTKAIIF